MYKFNSTLIINFFNFISKMSLKTIRMEALSNDEINFLSVKQEKERRTFYFGMKLMLIVCLIMPLFVATIIHFEDKPVLSFKEAYWYAQITMVLMFIFVMMATYTRKLLFINLDLKHQQKMIESVEILQKKFMPQNQSFHFYIKSQIKLSIEVTQNDFLKFVEGDEINIEYSKYSKEYFGYF